MIYGKNATVPETPDTTFGPYGDKTLHGSKIISDTAKAKPDGETDFKSLHWTFTFYAPANAAELNAFVKAKPDVVLDLVTRALGTSARAASWGECRGGAVTVDVKMPDGKVALRTPQAVYDAMVKAGMKVSIIPRTKEVKRP